MRLLAPLMLAGLLALTAQPASALCAADGDGGCSALRHDLLLDVRDDCPDAAPLCLRAPDDVDALFVPSGGLLNLSVRNTLQVPLTLEVLATARFDDATGDDAADHAAGRLRADLLATLADIQPAEVRNLELALDGNVSRLRLQALSEDGRQGELDADVTPIMAMTGGLPEPAQEPADERAASKGAPMPGVLAIVAALGAAALLAGLGRRP